MGYYQAPAAPTRRIFGEKVSVYWENCLVFSLELWSFILGEWGRASGHNLHRMHCGHDAQSPTREQDSGGNVNCINKIEKPFVRTSAILSSPQCSWRVCRAKFSACSGSHHCIIMTASTTTSHHTGYSRMHHEWNIWGFWPSNKALHFLIFFFPVTSIPLRNQVLFDQFSKNWDGYGNGHAVFC